MKNLKITAPEGFEIDKQKSTFEEIIFKPIQKEKPETFEDALNMLPENDEDVVAYKAIENINIPEHLKAYIQLVIITKVLNKGHIFNWNSGTEYKYFPWFDLEEFAFHDVRFQYGTSPESSRLCFKTRELAEFAAENFSEIYQKYLQQ